MKNIEREIDLTRGFDLIVSKTGEIISHFNTYEEAVDKQRGHDGWYIRYFVKVQNRSAEPLLKNRQKHHAKPHN